MGVVSGLVDTADGMLDSVAASNFSAIVGAMGNLTALMATLALVLVGINVVMQYRPTQPGQVLVVAIKLVAISAIGLKWGEFHKIAGAVQSAMDGIGGAILAGTHNGGGGGVGGTLAGAIDDLISRVAVATNNALSNLSWYGGLLLAAIIAILLAIIGCVAGLALIFSKVVVMVYISLAPIFIALWIFDATSDYFHKWLQATISYMLYPPVVAAVLGGMIRLISAYISGFSTSVSGSIAEFIPFLVALMVMIVVSSLIPQIVNALSGAVSAAGPVAALRGFASAPAKVASSGRDLASSAKGVAKGASAMASQTSSLASRIAARAGKF